MKLVSSILGMTLASAVAIVSANAADMYVPGPASYKDGPVAAPLWNGAYVGINGGYAWGNNSSLSALTDPCAPTASCPTTTKHSFAPDGGFGGGQIGYNWQPGGQGGFKDGPAAGNLVFGIEADIQGADIIGSETLGTATAKTNLDWFGTVRGRVGYAVGAALLYGTGGVAFGGVQDKLAVTGSPTVTHSATATGYAAGGGVEYAFSQAWSGKAEYQYINLGTDSLVNGGVTADFNHEYNTVRLGLNYHVLPGYEPLK
jgi:outer membrane immunogenic protein